MSQANNKFNLLVRCCQHLAQVIKQRPSVGNTASQISLPYNATINVPLKISYALIPIPKSSQNHPNTIPNPILKDISHQHMEGIQFLVLDETLQSSTSITSSSGRPMVGQGFHQFPSRDPFLLWPFHRGTAVGQCTERSFGNLKANGVLNGDEVVIPCYT